MITVTGHRNDNVIRDNENQTTLATILKDIMIEMTDRAFELENNKNEENKRLLFKMIYTNILCDYKKDWFMDKYTFDKYADDLPFYFNDLEKKCVPAEYLLVFYEDRVGKRGIELSRHSTIESVEVYLTNWSLFKGKHFVDGNKEGLIILRNGKVINFDINAEKKLDEELKVDFYKYTISNMVNKEDNQVLSEYFEEFFILYDQPNIQLS